MNEWDGKEVDSGTHEGGEALRLVGGGIDAETVKAKAAELGFVACGITDPAPSARGEELDRWLEAGYAGTMRYLHRQARRRKEPQSIVPGARSVVVVLDNYYSPDDQPTSGPRIAKYARGEDYHRVMQRRLEELSQFLRDAGAAVARSYVDAGPVPERELAERSGLGWVGKNTMLIRPGLGSFFFIGSVFTDLELAIDHPQRTDHCGSCTRCLDACPTMAFVLPRVLDATRCISYLTIEYKGEIPEKLAGQLEGYAFGCDICNDVCPWNERFAVETAVAAYRPKVVLADAGPEYFDRMDGDEFAARFGDTALERAGVAGMRRNWRLAHPPEAERKGDR